MKIPRFYNRRRRQSRTLRQALSICLIVALLAGVIPPPVVQSVALGAIAMAGINPSSELAAEISSAATQLEALLPAPSVAQAAAAPETTNLQTTSSRAMDLAAAAPSGSAMQAAALAPIAAPSALGVNSTLVANHASAMGRTEHGQETALVKDSAYFQLDFTGSSVLTVTKTVDWGTNTPDPAQQFAIQIEGPSFVPPTSTMIVDGQVLTFSVEPGVYTVTETSPGAGWVTTYTVDSVDNATSGVVNLLNENNATLAAAPISGQVFRDFNSDGQITTGAVSDVGMADVTVTAYDKAGNVVGTATTDANGDYTISPTGDGPYRVEFTDLPDGFEPTTHGADTNSTVQFVMTAGEATSVNLGINRPCDYCQDNPSLATTMYQSGDPLPVGSETGGEPTLIEWPYTYEGDSLAPDTRATASETGATWGLAYQRQTGTIFSSAVVRRHVGLGPDGLGAIYKTDASGTSLLVDVTSLGIDVGTLASNTDRGLPTNPNGRSVDQQAFDGVGQLGIGDIDLADDGKTLYLTNLNERNVYGLPFSTLTATPTAAIRYDLPTTSCINGVARPWGLKFYQDHLYVGVVCTGENEPYPASQVIRDNTNLAAFVYVMDTTAAVPAFATTPVLNFSLAYERGCAALPFDNDQRNCAWNPWTAQYTDAHPTQYGEWTYPSAILSDIEFDIDGAMILAFSDRWGLQTGAQTYWPNGANDELTVAGGDILRAWQSGNQQWTLENGGDKDGAGPFTPTGDNTNNEGPGGGEFYYSDRANGHQETAIGAVALWPGSDVVVAAINDPLRGNSSGTAKLSSTTGDASGGYQLRNGQNTKDFGKAGGLGDIELLCDPAPLEIGNRIWEDLDNDGIQDPGEPGINGLTVSLQGPTGTVTTQTDTDGNWYFAVSAYTNYTITAALPADMALTTANADGITTNAETIDLRDSDAYLVNELATIWYTTGGPGENNHTLDIGFVTPPTGWVEITNVAPPLSTVSLGNLVWFDTNNNGVVDGTEQNVSDGVLVELYQDTNGDGVFSSGDTRITSTLTSGGYYTFTDLAPTTDISTTYLVVISDTNFALGGPLYGYVNSDGQYADNLDANGDNTDHGTSLSAFGGGIVASTPISLTVGNQPAGEGNEGNEPIQTNNDANSNQTIDFGFYQLVLGNRIWIDENNNGLDDGEPALATTLTVTATNQSTGDVYTTTTDDNGYYTFTGIVSGTYVVSFDAPLGYVSSSTDGTPNGADLDDNGVGSSGGVISSEPFALVPGIDIAGVQGSDDPTGTTTNPSVDFGLWQPLALGNYVWLDTSEDGLQNEAAINGVNGVTVTLFYSNPVTGLWEQRVATTTANHPITNDPGYYTFTNLISGTYYVSFTLPTGYGFTTQDAGSDEAVDSDADPITGTTAPLTLNAGEQNPDVDAGLVAPTLSLGNRVWYDVDNNGRIDAGENGLDSVRVELYRDSDGSGDFTPGVDAYVAYSDTVDGGYYTFTNLSEGGYLVVISDTNFSGVLLNYHSSTPTTADPNDNVDRNDNGVILAGGVVASGVITLTLNNEPDGSPDVDGDSDANTNWTVDFGFYLADLGDAPGSYSTTLSNGTPYTGASHLISDTLYLGSRVDADEDGQPVVTGAAATNDDDTIAAAAVGGAGDDEDGIVFINELIAGRIVTVEVTVMGDGGYLNGWLDFGTDGTWTQAGDQIFDGLAVGNGTTTLTFTVPLTASTNITTYARFRLSTDADLNFYDTSTPAPNGEVEDYDVVLQALAHFGDRVWLEEDGDGLAGTDPMTPIAGMVITATNGTDVYTTTTNAAGYYSFTVPADTYTVTYGAVPAGYGTVTPSTVVSGTVESGNAGSYAEAGDPDANHGQNTTVTVASGEANWHVDFAFTPVYVLIGDYLWVEDDNNGDATDGFVRVVAGQVVTATASDGMTYTDTTDTNGRYTITVPANDTYTVTTGIPTGVVDSPVVPNAGNHENHDRLGTTVVVTTTDNLSIDFGYFEPVPSVSVIKYTNGMDADLATGPIIAVGETVTWTYDISNTGTVTLTNIVLADDVEGTVTCPVTELAPGAGTTCVLTGTTTAGQYANTAIVTGTPTLGPVTPVTDTNPSHYYGGNPGVQLIKYTNGYDADNPTGPYIGVGEVVTWTYVITNTGNQALTNLTLVDDIEGSITCPVTDLAAGASTTCTWTGTATAGQYANTAVVSGTTPGGSVLTFTNPSHYYGVDPDIMLTKYTNGEDADSIPGPTINEGDTVTWTYVVTNTGNVDLTNLTLVDDIEGTITCPVIDLAMGASTICVWTGTAISGQYTNTAVVTGTPDIPTNPTPDLPGVPTQPTPNEPVTDTNPSHYFGQAYVLIGDYLWVEDDNNGDATDGFVRVVAGQVVTATASDGTTYTDTTDAGGRYTITVPANDTYTVTTGIPNGVVDSPVRATDGADLNSNNLNHERLGTTVVMTTTDNLSIDFGFYRPAQFGDRVWIESDSDGLANTGDITAVAGMVITATSSDNTVYTATTNATGYYSFTVPGDTYVVTYDDVPASYGAVVPSSTPGGNSETGDAGVYAEASDPDQSHANGTTVTVAGGEANWTIDFGFNALPAQFGDRILIEDDGDGLANSGVITPVMGMFITATNGTDVYTTTTNADGYYSFTVPADTYTVIYGTVPASYGDVTPSTVISNTENGNAGSYREVGNPDANHAQNTVVTLAAGEANWRVDFIFTPVPEAPLYSLGNRLWIDDGAGDLANRDNGLYDAGELPVAEGVMVDLYTVTGTLVATTTTDLAGYYRFDGLAAGDYYVQIPADEFQAGGLLTDMSSSTGLTTTFTTGENNLDHGDDDTSDGVTSEIVTLGADNPTGEVDGGVIGAGANGTTGDANDNLTVDFGFVPPLVLLGDRLWIEDDNDGDATTGNVTPVSGQVVTATSSGGMVYTATTNANGLYTITVPANDTYEVTTGIPADTQDSPVLVSDGSDLVNNNDRNHDRLGTTVVMTTTDNLSIDFGFYQAAQFGDRVWIESDSDGLANTGTIIPVAGMVITATDGTNTYTTTTNAAGYYSFTVPGDTYVVTYGDVPASYGAVAPSSTPGGNTESGDVGMYEEAGDPDKSHANGTTVTVAGGEANWHVDFAFNAPLVLLGDRLWIEDDNDGDATTGNVTPVSGQVVTATSSSGTVYTGVTDGNGLYTITVPANDTYTVTTGIPTGVVDGPVVPGAGNDENHDRTGTTVVMTTTDNLSIDFGYYLAAQFGDRVWIESDNDGLASTGTLIPVAGMVITATASDGTEYTTTTDAAGYYSFTVPGGTYTVNYGDVPASYGAVVPSSTPGGNSASGDAGIYADASDPDQSHENGTTVTVAGGEANWTIDFAFNLPPATIGDRVWYDDNRDGVQDSGENGVADVIVELLDASGTLVDLTLTNASGYYSFTNLVPGDYSVRFDLTTLPTGYVVSPQGAGGDDATDSDADPIIGETMPTTLDAGEYDPTWDMGIYLPPATIGDRVWYDTNADGVQDAGETGVVSVTVELLDSNGTVVLTTTTDASGYYSFTNLVPGDYSVRFVLDTLPTGYVLTMQDSPDAADDSEDSDADPTTGETIQTTLDAGEFDPTWDMGIYQPASLGDRVWYDTNADGVQDAGEDGVEGVQVVLYDVNNTPVATTTTDVDGIYAFTDLVPGDYYVVFTPPAGHEISPQDNSGDDTTDSDADPTTGATIPTTLTSGENDPTWDLGLYEPAGIGDYVWYDANRDGVQDGGETGVENVTVELLDSNSAVISTTQTNASGYYSFTNLVPGDYSIRFDLTTLPTGYVVSEQDAANATDDTDDSDADVATGTTMPTILESGEYDPTWDMGIYQPPASIGDRVWHDINANGIQDAGEPGIPGVTVTLYDNNGVVTSTTTLTDGLYLFEDLNPGEYYVHFTPPAGYEISPVDQGNDDGVDSDVQLDGTTVPTILDPGENDPTWDMGLYQPVAIGDRVWYDDNRNGMQDAGELGVENVMVELLDSNGQVISTTQTNAAGIYSFTNLMPGVYQIRFVTNTLPTDYILTATDGTTDDLDSDADPITGTTLLTTLDSGEYDPTWDAGIYLPPVGLGDRVWYDDNRNGVQDGPESGVENVVVELLNSSGQVISTTTTDSSGYYSFTNLLPGVYGIRFVTSTLPADYRITSRDAGGDDTTDSDADPATGATITTTLSAGEYDPTWDMGIYLPPAAIGNRVWLDSNRNGVQDAGEPGLPGVVVNLLDASGAVITTTTTDASGLYTFTNLLPGDYAIEFVQTDGYTPSPQDASGDDATDSDADPTTGRTVTTTLSPDETDPTWDAGFYPILNLGNLVWHDANNNGLVDAGEEGIRNVMVQLFREGDDPLTVTPLLTDTTDVSGTYAFNNLEPGRYFVYIPTPPVAYPWSSTPTDSVDNGEDNDDNGTQSVIGEPVTSPVIELGVNSEPTNDGDSANGDLTVDFGFFASASLGDLVWLDTDNDGVQDQDETGVPGTPDELGVPGVLVTLYDVNNTVVKTTTTNTNGRYLFDNLLPGAYRVGFDVPAGYTVSPVDQGGNDAFDSDATMPTLRTPVTNLTSGEHNPTLDLGLHLPTEPASIGDRVWYDTDKDGVQDAGEMGVPGVLVTLHRADGSVVATTRTDENGEYRFNSLPAGDYYVEFDLPTSYRISPQDAGTDDGADSDVDPTTGRTINTTLDAGEDDPSWDLGLYLDGEPASIGDTVWFDTDVDGIQDAGETGVPGVIVTLYQADGTPIATTRTDADGHYAFTNLAPGDYYVEFDPPAGYIGTVADRGGDDALDSDVDLPTGRTIVTTLDAGENDPTWDYGIFLINVRNGNLIVPTAIGNRVWVDANQDGIQDANEVNAPGVTVKLYTGSGELVATDITDANGLYNFGNLVPGDYYVEVVLPEGYQYSPVSTTLGDDTDSNADPNTGRTPVVTLLAGSPDPTWDTGIYLIPTNLGDEDEPKKEGVSIFLPLIAR